MIDGFLENTVRYTMTALDEGTVSVLPSFSLELDGTGAVESETQSFVWGKYKLGKAVTTLSIGENITGIEENAFASFRTLKEIDLKSSNFLLEDNVLYTADGTRVITATAAVESYAMPDSVSSMDAGAFASANAMHTVTTGAGLSTLPEYAFAFCTALENIELSESLKTIETAAFRNCTALQALHIPASVTNISSYAFIDEVDFHLVMWTLSPDPGYISNLQSITVDSANPVYCSDDGVLFNKEKTELLLFPQKKTDSASYTVPDSVYRIGPAAFYGCTELSNITLPKGLYFIESYAFAYCGFSSITLPQSTATIGAYAFAYCHNLSFIVIPSMVFQMGERVFFSSVETEGPVPGSVTGATSSALTGVYCRATDIPVGGRLLLLPDGTERIISADWKVNTMTGGSIGWHDWDSGLPCQVYWGDEWEYIDGVPTVKK